MTSANDGQDKETHWLPGSEVRTPREPQMPPQKKKKKAPMQRVLVCDRDWTGLGSGSGRWHWLVRVGGKGPCRVCASVASWKQLDARHSRTPQQFSPASLGVEDENEKRADAVEMEQRKAEVENVRLLYSVSLLGVAAQTEGARSGLSTT